MSFFVFLFLERKRANCLGGYGLTAIATDFGWLLPTVVFIGAQLIWRGHRWFHFVGVNISHARTQTVQSLSAQRGPHWPSSRIAYEPDVTVKFRHHILFFFLCGTGQMLVKALLLWSLCMTTSLAVWLNLSLKVWLGPSVRLSLALV